MNSENLSISSSQNLQNYQKILGALGTIRNEYKSNPINYGRHLNNIDGVAQIVISCINDIDSSLLIDLLEDDDKL